MNEAKARRLVEALRSGKYNQASTQLCYKHDTEYGGESSYCCLGVAAELDGALIKDDGAPYAVCYDDADPDYCHQSIAYYYGGNSGLDRREAMHLASRNDRGESFSQIADAIEDHLDKGTPLLS